MIMINSDRFPSLFQILYDYFGIELAHIFMVMEVPTDFLF